MVEYCIWLCTVDGCVQWLWTVDGCVLYVDGCVQWLCTVDGCVLCKHVMECTVHTLAR